MPKKGFKIKKLASTSGKLEVNKGRPGSKIKYYGEIYRQ